MIKRIELLRSFSWVAFANVITKPLWMLLVIYAARVLGPEQYGIYSYAFSVIIFLSLFMDLGLDYIAVKETARDFKLSNEYFNSINVFRFAILIVTMILLSLFGIVTDNIGNIQFICIFILFLFQFLTIELKFFKSLVTSKQEFSFYALLLIIEKVLITLFGFIMLMLSAKIIPFLSGLLLGNLINFLIVFFCLKKRYSFSIKLPSFSFLKILLTRSIPILIMNIFIMAYFRIDIIILDFLTGDKTVVGIYGAIHRLIEMYLLFPSILMSAAYPIIAKKFEEDKLYTLKLIEKIITTIIVISTLIVVLFSFNAFEMINVLFGASFKDGAQGLLILIWTTLPLGLNYILGHLIIIIEKQKYSAKVTAIAAVLNISMNFLLIPTYSLIGSSIAAFISECTILIFYSYIILKSFGDIKLLSYLFKLIFIVFILVGMFQLAVSIFEYSFFIYAPTLLLVTILLFIIFKFIDIKNIRIIQSGL